MKTPHTSCVKGKKVSIMTKDGELIYDQFIERKGKYIFLKRYGKMLAGKVKSFMIRR